MKKNIGPIDAWIRSLLGLELLITGLMTAGGPSGGFGTWSIVIATGLIIEALFEYSPVYALLRLNTDENKQDEIKQFKIRKKENSYVRSIKIPHLNG